MAFSTAENYKPINLKDSNLFKPIKLNDEITLKQRIAMAPLTRFRADDTHVPNKDGMAAEYYEQRASAEGTLLVTEATLISPQAGGFLKVPGLWNSDQMEQWAKIFERIHQKKSFMFVQLWHLGRQGVPAILKAKGLKYVSASDDVYMDEAGKKNAIACGNELKGLTIDEIKETVQDFVKAAQNVIKYGGDGVELHSANGYLLNQFLDPITNKRTDKYGGSIENRSRLTLEVVDAIVEAIGAQKVGIRLSPYATFGGMSGGEDPLLIAQYSHIIGELEKRAQKDPSKRLAYIHIIEPRVVNPGFAEGTHEYLGGTNDFVFSIWKGTVMRTGGFAIANEVLLKDVNQNDRTLIAFGRFFLANPDLVYRLQNELPLNQYDRSTFYTNNKEGYTDYPFYSSTS